MANQLIILEWNANGLLQHQRELQVVLDSKKIDVCLISETHFTKESYIKFKGYKVYSTIHPDNAAKGGAAVIIKESITHYQEMGWQNEQIQATAVNVRTKSFDVVIAAIYSPPRHAVKKENYVEFLKSQGPRFIIGGDFNAKHTHWASRLTTPKGKELFQACNEEKCEIMSTGKPTYWPADINKIPDLIDFFIIKNISLNYLKVEESCDLHSDHSPIMLILNSSVVLKETPPRLTSKETDWEYFQYNLENRIELSVPIKTKQQLDDEVERLTKDIQQSAWNSTPEIPSKRTRNNIQPKEIRMLIQEKRKLRRKWKQCRNPANKTALNNCAQHLKRMIKENTNKVIENYLIDLTNDSTTEYSLWKATKRIKRPVTSMPPIRSTDGTWARSNEQKANRFAEHLENTFKPNESNVQIDLEEEEPEDKEIKPTSPNEIYKMIKNNISCKKAPGFDLITGEIVKNLPRKAIIKLTHLINASFRLEHVPWMWKTAEVLMMAKPGKPANNVTSYRPISLLPVLSKLYEKILIKRLKPIVETKKLIPNHQFGFREKHSTIDQVHRITYMIEQALEEKKVCTATFLDVEQAFDKVWHEGLNYKIRKYLPRQHSKLLESYLSNRYFRVRQEDSYSEIREIKAGVPQGSVLGPFLYTLYTCDIPKTEHDIIATFADDTGILSVGDTHQEAAEKAQESINKINLWTQQWKINLNKSKSVHINFTNKKEQYYPIKINNTQVPYANEAKYLGFTLDSKLRWKPHIKRKVAELNIKFKKMYWLLGRNSKLSTYNKLLLYKQSLKPIWTYGAQLWGCTSKSNKEILQRFQNKILRNIVDAPWYVRNCDIHRDLGMDTVDQAISRIAYNHEQRLHRHVNIEAIQLLDTTNQTRRLKRKKPFELV